MLGVLELGGALAHALLQHIRVLAQELLLAAGKLGLLAHRRDVVLDLERARRHARALVAGALHDLVEAHQVRVGARVVAGRGRQAGERRERVPRRVAIGRELAGLLEHLPRRVRVARGGLALAERGESVGEHVLRAGAACDLDGALERLARLFVATQGAQRVARDQQAGADAAEQPVALGDALGVAREAERGVVFAEAVLRTAERLQRPHLRDRLRALDRQGAVEVGDRAVGLVEDLEVDAGDVGVEHRERRRVLQVGGRLARLRVGGKGAVGLPEVVVDDGLRVVQAEAREIVLEIAERLEAGERVLERGCVVPGRLEADGHGGLAGRDRARARVLGLLGLDRVGLGEREQRIRERLLGIDGAQHASVLAPYAGTLRRRRPNGRQRFQLAGQCPKPCLGLARTRHRVSP